ncbi:hypothetical protein ACFFOS_27015 [Nocardioides kongjuensis]|uniref:hypothetical protein n=1 Tax=Nocardioides kongjuensis TaxID=349522 RepID=UPI0015C8D235|nr:hypothetical protein [Nocardioides kongjuensis]
MRISVLGTGYRAATHAACLAEAGHDVVGIDRDVARIATLAAGRARTCTSSASAPRATRLPRRRPGPRRPRCRRRNRRVVDARRCLDRQRWEAAG